jgi:hypothetical protein
MSWRVDVVRALRFASYLGLLSISCSGDPPVSAPVDSGFPDVDLATCAADASLRVRRADCPSDFPTDTDCPSASPVYADVAPIFAARCSICHRANGLVTNFQFDTYAEIHDNEVTRADIITQIYSCRMPPSCAPNLLLEERQVMLKWFACSAPEDHDSAADAAPDAADDAAPAD